MSMSYASRTRVTLLLVILAMIVAILTVSSTRTVTATVPDGMELVAENEYLSLYIDPDTAEISVLDKRTGSVWYSNPPDRNRMETIARGTGKKALGAQLTIAYFTPDGLRRVYDSYNNSVELGQFEIQPIDRGVRVEYLLGQKWRAEDYLPVMVDRDKFEDLILAKVTKESDRKLLLNSYDLISLQPLTDESEESYNKSLLGDYKLVLHESLTGEPVDATQEDLFDRVASQIVKYNDNVKSRAELKEQHFAHLRECPTYVLRNTVIRWDLADIQDIVKNVGYSPEEIQNDHRDHQLNVPVPNPEVFEVAIEYTLDKDNLVVRVPTADIVYPLNAVAKDGSIVTYLPYMLNVLPYFGAADRDQEGYIFVPDGSGALIYLNNGKTTAPQYLRPVYGSDRSLGPVDEVISVEQQIHLPVFGMKRGDQAFLAVIESSDSTARINADVAGRSDSYNKVSAQFVLIAQGETALKGDISGKFSVTNMKVQTKINVYQSRMFLEDICIRYFFLDGDDADYVGMAKSYRDYLIEKGSLRRLEASDNVPLYLEIVGAATREKPIMGLPRKVAEPLTTYEEVGSIATELLNAGIKDIRLVYSGWMAGGVKHVYPQRVRLEKALGTRDDLTRTIGYLKSAGVKVFPEVGFLQVYRNTLGDGFNLWSSGARFLNGKIATVYEYNTATMQYDPATARVVVSPSILDRLIDRFCLDFAEYRTAGIALTHMGRQINSDYREDPNELIDRQQALGVQERQLQKLSGEHGYDVMVRGGNAYVLPYVSDIVEMPTASSAYRIFDRSIPFYQIVTHGFIGYAGEPINFSSDYLTAALKTIETGSNPYFKVCWRDASVLKGSESQYLYSLDFDHWRETILTFYASVNDMLRDVQDQVIIGHTQLEEGVFKTTYENGVEIIVDYNTKQVYRR